MFGRSVRMTVRFRIVVALLLLAIESGLLAVSPQMGPYVPLLAFDVLVIYGALNIGGRAAGYSVAILAAVGRTVIHGAVLPDTSFNVLFAWHLFNTTTALLLICYLLDRSMRRADIAELAHRGMLFGCGIGAVAVSMISLTGHSAYVSADANSARVVAHASATAFESNDAEVFGDEKIALLTIDDAPRDRQTDERLLEILQKHAVKAVWFVNCVNFDRMQEHWAEREQMLSHIRDQGHMIGNHSYEHLDLVKLEQKDPGRMAWQIDHCSEAIKSTAGIQPRYFRAPFGAIDNSVIETSNRAGMVVMKWSVPFDQLFQFNHKADQTPALAAVEQLADTVENGDILLLHDDMRTAKVLDEFLTRLERRGFRFILPPPDPTRDWTAIAQK